MDNITNNNINKHLFFEDVVGEMFKEESKQKKK